mgnify:CR=1 FL=1
MNRIFQIFIVVSSIFTGGCAVTYARTGVVLASLDTREKVTVMNNTVEAILDVFIDEGVIRANVMPGQPATITFSCLGGDRQYTLLVRGKTPDGKFLGSTTRHFSLNCRGGYPRSEVWTISDGQLRRPGQG